MDDPSILDMLKQWIFVVALTFFIIIGSVAAHEMGHAVAAHLYGCDVEQVTLYVKDSHASTRIQCEDNSHRSAVAISGMAANILFGIIFMFSTNNLMNNLSYMLIGFGLYSGKMDLQAMGFSSPFASAVSIVGVLVIMYSLYLLCKIGVSDLFKSEGVPS